MIRIAFIIDTIESPSAGTEKQLLLLIKHLDRARFQPYLCVLRSSTWLRQNFHDCELIDIDVPSFCNPSSYIHILKFAGFLKKQKIDVIQTHFVEGNKVGVVAGRLASVQVIVSTRRNQGYWHKRSDLLILRIINTFVVRFLANSESTALWLNTTEGINQERIDVIYNAIEIEHYGRVAESQRSALKKNLGFPADSIVIGIAANLRPVKAIDVFIKAAKLVSEQCPHARFMVIGEGPERKRLELLGSELGLSSVLCFMGQRFDIPELLACTDIGILSSDSESFSNSIVEYLAAGLPVVCTDVGGAREAVSDGVNGYVVNAGDYGAMAGRVIDILNSENRRELGANSRKKAEDSFSLPAIMQRYGQFYERVMGV